MKFGNTPDKDNPEHQYELETSLNHGMFSSEYTEIQRYR